MNKKIFFLMMFLLLGAPLAFAGGMSSPENSTLFVIFVCIVGTLIFSEICILIKQPSILGGLFFGMIIISLKHFNIETFEFLDFNYLVSSKTEDGYLFRDVESLSVVVIAVMANMGGIFILFKAGLHTSLAEMLSVGKESLAIAIIGIVAPMFFGYFTSKFFYPESSEAMLFFIGATLCATSIGITFSVFEDLGKSNTLQAKQIMGAAVIDDILGLILLSVAIGKATPHAQTSVILISIKSILAVIIVIGIGKYILPHAIKITGRFRSEAYTIAVTVVLSACFLFSWIASLPIVGLASIIGAFCCGLMLHDKQLVYIWGKEEKQESIEHMMRPIERFLSPIFFFAIGMQADIIAFLKSGTQKEWTFIITLTVLAIVGKMLSGLGTLSLKPTNFFIVGIGMVPRGEVGFIFALIGKSISIEGKPIFSQNMYTGIIFLLTITTVAAPILLKLIYSNIDKETPSTSTQSFPH